MKPLPTDAELDRIIRAAVISADELRDLVQLHAKFMMESLRDAPTSSWTPALLVLLREDMIGEKSTALCMLSVPFNEDHEKHAVLANLGREFHDHKKLPVAAVLSAEAWSAPGGPGTGEPRHHTQKEEVMIVMGMRLVVEGDRSPVSFTTTAPVTRGRDDIIVCGDFAELQDSSAYLLRHLWAGFFGKVQAMRN